MLRFVISCVFVKVFGHEVLFSYPTATFEMSVRDHTTINDEILGSKGTSNYR